ncbi:unnamed protein product [Rotaria magnacalcarata]|uniref:Protein prenyltransferase alpha subunit repeat-containing protein 1 n=1 Tax=Rotaria magnacalcarata TaxID=392030 RepID=A0A815A721_9BILA|nr:unnamed protein product [Rotaria magnacalcarata]CAF1252017.1 unnamed protein product [Rotaria magnacalcarata]CAF1904892.1 unnamed protein product [Rotaria magnacalcarata]CAF1931558.1 unnamed protein product [Rotaria magnacalcarata]CAF2048184.1 unnamed protein product [Rotaria magnacalcarata]
MSITNWSLISLLSSSIEQCKSIEFMPLTSTDEYKVYCCCEENIYLCLNILEIKPIVNLCYSFIFSKDYQQDNQLNISTRVLLCYITECLTSWNIRRRLLLSRIINIQEELQFLDILLNLKPKSEQLFRYRRWILKQEGIDKVSTNKELELCDRTAEKHFINYASWLHRRWIIQYLNVNIDEELERNRLWLENNLSDSSGYSFRAHLLSKKVLDENLIRNELNMNDNMLEFYYDRESLWIYRQTLIFLAMKFEMIDKKQLLNKELDSIKNIQENFFSNKYSRLLNTLLSSDGKQFRT